MAVIRKPDTDRKTYNFVLLENGVKAITVSDPECDMAAAAACVNVGMCHERKDLPGLAHFLEHMLFTGTKKYPSEGEYTEFISQNGGDTNAYTMCYITAYHFSVKPACLEPALDRFARFFYEPLLTRDCTEREINAVDSEYQAGLTSPWWRYVGIMNMSANPEHPFHVAVGNNKVLLHEPKARGIDLYDEMIKFYDSTYSANGLTVCVVGKETPEELEKIVREKFGPILNKGYTMPLGDSHSDKPPFLPHEWNRLLLQTPVQDIKQLEFTWVIPYQTPHWRSKPSSYICHLLGYEGTGSVISVLKQKGLISGCSAGNGAWLEGSFSLLQISFDLTDKGLNEVEEIGAHMFAFLAMMQKGEPEKWIWDEMRKIKEVKFKFKEDQRPMSICTSLCQSLQELPPEEVMAGTSCLYEYAPEKVSSILKLLTLDSVRVSMQAKTLADQCTDRDPDYNAPMKFLPIKPEWLAKWNSALSPGDGSVTAAVAAASTLGMHMPKPNPFLPEDLTLRPAPAAPQPLPVALSGLESPLTALFHRQDDIFKQPKAIATFRIYSPFLYKDVVTATSTELWCNCITEALNEYAYDAAIAGVSYSLSLNSGAIHLTLSGFNDKLGTLLDAVTAKITALHEIPEGIYDIVSDAYNDEIRNIAFHSRPYTQCTMRFTELTSRGTSYPSYKRYEAFQGLKRQDLTGLAAKIFGPGSAVEGIVLGNQTPEDAKMLASALVKGLGLKQGLAAIPDRLEAKLPPGHTLWRLQSTDVEDPNHAVVLRVQTSDSVEDTAHLKLADRVLGSKFFDILRTQQQLGYIVGLQVTKSGRFQYLVCVIQTEFPPDYVRSRIDSFLNEHLEWVAEKLSDTEFETCRTGVLAELRTKPKNLIDEMGHYSGAFLERTFDYERRQNVIHAVESVVTPESFKAYIRDLLTNRPRIYCQVRKTMVKEDKALPDNATIPATSPDIREWTTHQETVKAFAETTEWLPLNSNVSS